MSGDAEIARSACSMARNLEWFRCEARVKGLAVDPTDLNAGGAGVG